MILETAVEHILMHAYKEGMMTYMDAHPEEIEELIQLSMGDKQPYSWRAAWLLSKCMEENDERVKMVLPEIVNILPNVSDSQKRDLINVLRRMEIPEEQEGILFDTAVNFWCQIEKMPSLRFNAFKLILQIAAKNPELFQEVLLLTEDHYVDTLSPGVKRSLGRLVRKIGKR